MKQYFTSDSLCGGLETSMTVDLNENIEGKKINVDMKDVNTYKMYYIDYIAEKRFVESRNSTFERCYGYEQIINKIKRQCKPDNFDEDIIFLAEEFKMPYNRWLRNDNLPFTSALPSLSYPKRVVQHYKAFIFILYTELIMQKDLLQTMVRTQDDVDIVSDNRLSKEENKETSSDVLPDENGWNKQSGECFCDIQKEIYTTYKENNNDYHRLQNQIDSIGKLMDNFLQKDGLFLSQQADSTSSDSDQYVNRSIRRKIAEIEKRVETLEINTQEGNSLVHTIKSAFEKTDDKIKKIHAQDDAKIILENNKFMQIMNKAVEQEFCEKKGWQYNWKKKHEAAYFVSVASHVFGLTERKDHDGDIAISWKPFEALFGEEKLRLTYNDIQQCKTIVKRKRDIDNLFV